MLFFRVQAANMFRWVEYRNASGLEIPKKREVLITKIHKAQYQYSMLDVFRNNRGLILNALTPVAVAAPVCIDKATAVSRGLAVFIALDRAGGC